MAQNIFGMNHCSKCGAELEPSAEPAPCPACLLEAGLSFLPEQPKATFGPITEKPGDRIGRYKLLQQIGEGGCGVVYMAEQEEPVRRRLALKVLKLGMDTKSVIARFEAERQALALMDHPNIAKVHDAGATETGRPYFVMELVRGIKITDYCDEKNLPTQARLDLFVQVCHAVQHAHQKGIIHRDLKPSNILVNIVDGLPVPKVIDFGIAKATNDQRLTDKTVFTAFEQFIGTPAYMSPEQAEISGVDVDTRSDIYSLGVLLYELLTGKTPFDAKELLQVGLDEMRRTIREKEPDRPSTRVRTLGAGELTTTAKRRGVEAHDLAHVLGGDLDWIVMKCLEKDRTRRYETASGLASDILRHLNNEPVAARPPSALYRIEKLVRRNRLAFTAAALVALALVLGIVASTWQAKRAEAEALANRQNLYAADMNLANHALENYNLASARQLLEKHRPPGGKSSNSPLCSDLRGWEWRYLAGQCRSDEVATLARFDSCVFTVSISRDGHWLAAACGDGTVGLWDLPTRRQLPSFETYRGPASFFENEDRSHAAAFAPDCRTLAAGGTNKDIFLWDVVEHRKVAILTGHQGTIQHLAFSPDGRFLASASLDETARLWDMRSNPPRELTKLEPHIRGVICVAFSPDSRTLVTGGQSKPVKLWDVSNPQAPRQIGSLDSLWIEHAVFSPDGTRLAICRNQSVRLFEFPSLRELEPLRGQPGIHNWLAFSPDGRRLASAGGNLCICIWDLEHPEKLQMLKGHDKDPQCLAFTPDGNTLVSGGTDGTVRLWDMTTNSAAEPEFRYGFGAYAVAFSRDSRYVAVLEEPGHLILWDVLAGREAGTQNLADSYEGQIEFSPDGKTVCVTSAWRARWFEMPSLRLLKEEPADRLVLAQDGGFAMLARQGQIIRRDYPSGVEASLGSSAIVDFKASAALSPDGETFVIGGEEGKVALWHTHRPGPPTMLEGHKALINSLAFSPDGKWIASASWDGTIGLWQPNGRNIRFLRGHNGAVRGLAFSPDGRTLASAADDGTVKLWNLASMQEAATLHGHDGPVWVVAFSPSGSLLASAAEGVVRLWKAPTFEELSAAERLIEAKK